MAGDGSGPNPQFGFCDVVFLIRNGLEHALPPLRRSLPAKVASLLRDKRRRNLLAFECYLRLDAKLNPIETEADPEAPVDCSTKLEGIPSQTVQPIVKGFTHRFRKEDTAAIRDQNLDVILRWGFNIIHGEILETARFGVWSYHHGDNDFYRGGPAAFWEMVERSPRTGVLLQVLTDELDGGFVLAKGNVTTAPGLSLRRNRFEQYWHGTSFVIEKLWELHQHGWDFLKSKAVPNDFRGRKRIYRRPTNAQTASFLLRGGARKVVRRIAGAGRDQLHWRIGLRRGRPLDPRAESPDATGFRWLESPRGRYWADLFLLQREERRWLFFEDFLYAENRGIVSVVEVGPNGEIGDPQTALDLPYHLSYPFVFHDGGETYMIPETGDQQRVELFRALELPHRWEKVGNLAEGYRAYDVTVWKENGLYWFFVPVVGYHGARYETFLFHAESLTGEWRCHRASPISRDIRFARGAGTIFIHEGCRIRPTQDGSLLYGGSLRFEEIVELTPERYEARPLGHVEPGRIHDGPARLVGAHTYHRLGDWEVIDGVSRERQSDLI